MAAISRCPQCCPVSGLLVASGGTMAEPQQISLISLLVGPHNAPPFISSEEASLTGYLSQRNSLLNPVV